MTKQENTLLPVSGTDPSSHFSYSKHLFFGHESRTVVYTTERNLLCMCKYQCLRLAGQLTDSRRLAYAVFHVYL